MNRFVHVARLVLEAESALSIGARKGGERDDVILIADAMGLPTLPASSLAGALRAMAKEHYGESFAKELFGHLSSKGGQRSRVVVGWGLCHGADDKPMESVADEAAGVRWGSPLVQRLRSLVEVPVKRDRVALDHRATARPRGKFDRSVVPKGTRFTVELRLWSAGEADQDWQRLLGLLVSPGLRLGGATRSGLGRLGVARAQGRHFDLSDARDAEAFRAVPTRYDRPSTLPTLTIAPPDGGVNNLRCIITLRPEGFVRVGQGDAAFLTDAADAKNATVLTQKSEPIIVWRGGQGSIERNAPLIPATSLKGALSDRVAFHAHRFAGRFVENAATGGWLAVAKAGPGADALVQYDRSRDTSEVQELFGIVGGVAGARAGRIVLEDAWLARPDEKGAMRVTHNVIDRFTGGVREHLLFTEEVLFKPAIRFELQVRQPETIGPAARRALKEALDDLVNGLLPIGAASTRGNGFFMGDCTWSDGGQWLKGETA